MKRFAIISNRIKDPELLEAMRIKAVFMRLEPTAKVDIYEIDESFKQTFSDVECLIVLGGDGSLLSVAKAARRENIPIIGVNFGGLGFLAEIELSCIDDAIKALLSDTYHIEERMMIEGNIGGSDENHNALNDIVLSRRGDLQVIGYRVYVNGVYLNDFFSDGIIVSTPTGSTGYNLSAGGSIVEPNAKLMVLTPVCPHTLNTRSIMLSADDEVKVEILPARSGRTVSVGAYFDGNNTVVLSEGDFVTVKKSSKVTKICKLSNLGFLEILHKKMSE